MPTDPPKRPEAHPSSADGKAPAEAKAYNFARPSRPIGLALDRRRVVGRTAEPCTVVIFGASGDLTQRKLVPALYALHCEGFLPPNFTVVGTARRNIDESTFRQNMLEGCAQFGRHKPDAKFDAFAQGVFFVGADTTTAEGMATLRARLEEIEAARGTGANRLFYLSTPPDAFPVLVQRLAQSGLLHGAGDSAFSRVVIEKPFGTDLASAQALNRHVAAHLREDQTYRIDHYLGKETVQNLMVFRFANVLFEPLWNNRYIDHVQITGAESIGIEGRGQYFERAGILRDMVQNHLFQVLALTAMEPPVSLAADDLRDEKVKVLKALRPIDSANIGASVVRAQYAQRDQSAEVGYRAEPHVAADSRTETYVALKLFVDNWRWAGVPFYLRSGKRMAKKVTEVALVFKDAPHRLFGASSEAVGNALSIRIQPDEGMTIHFGSKRPGNTLAIDPVDMAFRYGTSFVDTPPDAYERLLLDCLLGDASLYIRADEVEASWSFISRIHESWSTTDAQQGSIDSALSSYASGSWGPSAADALLASAGHRWRSP